MKLRAYDSRLVVEEVEEKEFTDGGIALPDNYEAEDHYRGRVISTGKGHLMDSGKRCPLDINVGETIIFHKHGGFDVKVDGKNYKVISAQAILGIIEE